MNEPTDREIIEAMTRHGGSFVRALAQAARFADSANLAKIKATWPEYWENYRKFVPNMKQTNQTEKSDSHP